MQGLLWRLCKHLEFMHVCAPAGVYFVHAFQFLVRHVRVDQAPRFFTARSRDIQPHALFKHIAVQLQVKHQHRYQTELWHLSVCVPTKQCISPSIGRAGGGQSGERNTTSARTYTRTWCWFTPVGSDLLLKSQIRRVSWNHER